MRYPQYNPALPQTPLDDDEIEQLESLLAAAPSDEAMNIECLDGYLTALLLAPELPSADDWVPPVWGGEPDAAAPFVSGKQTKRVVQLVLRHIASIDRQLHADEDMLQPFFAVAERTEPAGTPGTAATAPASSEDDAAEADDGLVVDATDWCIGFLTAVDRQPDAWANRLDEPAWAQEMAPICILGADAASLPPEVAQALEDPAERNRLSRQVPDTISALWRARGST